MYGITNATQFYQIPQEENLTPIPLLTSQLSSLFIIYGPKSIIKLRETTF